MLKKHRIVRFVNLKVTFLKTKSEANISVFWSCTVLSVVVFEQSRKRQCTCFFSQNFCFGAVLDTLWWQ